MTQQTQPRHIFISALEHSAEMHCVHLMAALHQKTAVWPGQAPPPENPMLRFAGFGGRRLAEAGCILLDDTVSRAAMIYNVLGQLGYYRKLIKQAGEYFRLNTVDLVIVCDSPAFNFHIARAAKQHGIPVLFYVAPQLWAWAPWRIGKLRRCCDKLACILPFEKDWFAARGIDAQFVSNPLFDPIGPDLEKNFKSYTAYDPAAPRIALLPGSREAEIRSLWPAMLKIAAALTKKHPRAAFTACAPDALKRALLEQLKSRSPQADLPIAIETAALHETARQADLALIASGSATLQAAAAGCPMIVMYQSNKWLWHLLARWLVRLRFLSLPNILAQRELVPEFMPYFTSLAPIIDRASGLLNTPSRLSSISQALIELVRPMAQRRASDAVADIVLQMLAH
ncbi:MAG: lipid-A-disaccharide synthase [Phycisphaerae bacterium]|nr:lipid-A-disaccharide synthase [Phycisphaerae bacterium]